MRTSEPAPLAWWPLAVFLGMGAAAGTTANRLLPSAGQAEAGQKAGEAGGDSHPAPSPAEGAPALRPVLNLIGESLGLGPDPQRAEAARSVSLLQRYLATTGKKGKPPAANGSTAVLAGF